MKIEIDGRTLEIVTDMTPLKSINERYSSNIAFVFENGARLLSSKLDSKVKNHQLHSGSDIKGGYSVTEEFSIAWMVLQLGQQVSKKVCKHHDWILYIID